MKTVILIERGMRLKLQIIQMLLMSTVTEYMGSIPEQKSFSHKYHISHAELI